jgi:hypothetical protein
MKQAIGKAVILFSTMAGSVLADPNIVVDTNEKVYGKSLDEYTNIWWQWANSMSDDESPVTDKTGARCHINQHGHVWFLAGGYGSSKITRKCSIPKDNYIFFPVINMLHYPASGVQLTCKSAKERAAMNNNLLRSFIVTIDNHKIVNPAFHRYSSPECFDLFDLVPKSTAPKAYPSATDGYWVMLRPLSPGSHRIKFRAEYHNPGQDFGTMIQDIEYQLDIVESSKKIPDGII